MEFVIDHLQRGAKDAAVAALAEHLGAVIFTWNRKDFQRLSMRTPDGKRLHFDNLSRLTFKCSDVLGAARMGDALPYIEFEEDRSAARPDRRLIMQIEERRIIIY